MYLLDELIHNKKILDEKRNIIIALLFIIVVGTLSAIFFIHSTIEAKNQAQQKIDEIVQSDVKQITPIETNKEINKKQFIALCLHQVNYSGKMLAITPKVFRNLIREFKDKGYVFLDVSDIRDIYYGKSSMPDKAVFLGFDDGYKDNYTYAYPILLEENVKATFFVVSSKIYDKDRLSISDMKNMMANGFKIGSHTVTHANTTSLTEEQINEEFRDSQRTLSEALNTPIYSLAYPCGFENSKVVDIARQYYDVAFTASVDNEQKETPFTIQRYGVFSWNTDISSILHNKQQS